MEFGPHILTPEDHPGPCSTQDHLAPLIMDALHEAHAEIMYSLTFELTCPYDAVIRRYGWHAADYVFLYPLSAECAARAIRDVTPDQWDTEDQIIRILEDYCDWVHRFAPGEL